jgi:hypothetical protein
VTAALLAVLAIPALWHISRHIRTSLRRAAVTAERLARPIPDPAPMPDWDQIAEQARYDDTFAEMTRNWNQDAT